MDISYIDKNKKYLSLQAYDSAKDIEQAEYDRTEHSTHHGNSGKQLKTVQSPCFTRRQDIHGISQVHTKYIPCIDHLVQIAFPFISML